MKKRRDWGAIFDSAAGIVGGLIILALVIEYLVIMWAVLPE